MTVETRPATDFVEVVAKMGHPEIMDIGSERLRKLVAMTFITEFSNDSSVKFEAVRDDILGIMTENVGDIQKQIQAAREAKQTKVAGDLYSILKPVLLKAATDIPSADRPLTFTILFDYATIVKNPDGTPVMDSDNNPKHEPNFDFKVHWTAETKKASTGATRTGNYQGRVAGSYTFPDSKNADGTLIEWGSMKKFALTKGYKDADGTPRDYLAKTYDIPNRPTKVGDKDIFVATVKTA